jgi:NCS1 family nucleobase:cation symporter-1
MEKVKSTKLAYWANKLAVESEPGLTNAQLMLNNHDLKPGKRDIDSGVFREIF